MKCTLIIGFIITLLGISPSFGEECNRSVLSSKNFSNCMKLSVARPMAKKFCTCVEENMDWEFMLKENTFIDRQKCEFLEIEKLISEKEVLEKCYRPLKVGN